MRARAARRRPRTHYIKARIQVPVAAARHVRAEGQSPVPVGNLWTVHTWPWAPPELTSEMRVRCKSSKAPAAQARGQVRRSVPVDTARAGRQDTSNSTHVAAHERSAGSTPPKPSDLAPRRRCPFHRRAGAGPPANSQPHRQIAHTTPLATPGLSFWPQPPDSLRPQPP